MQSVAGSSTTKFGLLDIDTVPGKPILGILKSIK